MDRFWCLAIVWSYTDKRKYQSLVTQIFCTVPLTAIFELKMCNKQLVNPESVVEVLEQFRHPKDNGKKKEKKANLMEPILKK